MLEQLGDVRPERDQVERVLAVAPDRHRAGHVLVQQPQRAAEQVDAGGKQRRPDAVVVEHQRLDQIVEMALVIGDVDHAAAPDAVLRELHVFGNALDLAQNRIERVLKGPVEPVALGGAEFFQVALDPLPRLGRGGLRDRRGGTWRRPRAQGRRV